MKRYGIVVLCMMFLGASGVVLGHSRTTDSSQKTLRGTQKLTSVLKDKHEMKKNKAERLEDDWDFSEALEDVYDEDDTAPKSSEATEPLIGLWRTPCMTDGDGYYWICEFEFLSADRYIARNRGYSDDACQVPYDLTVLEYRYRAGGVVPSAYEGEEASKIKALDSTLVDATMTFWNDEDIKEANHILEEKGCDQRVEKGKAIRISTLAHCIDMAEFNEMLKNDFGSPGFGGTLFGIYAIDESDDPPAFYHGGAEEDPHDGSQADKRQTLLDETLPHYRVQE